MAELGPEIKQVIVRDVLETPANVAFLTGLVKIASRWLPNEARLVLDEPDALPTFATFGTLPDATELDTYADNHPGLTEPYLYLGGLVVVNDAFNGSPSIAVQLFPNYIRPTNERDAEFKKDAVGQHKLSAGRLVLGKMVGTTSTLNLASDILMMCGTGPLEFAELRTQPTRSRRLVPKAA